MERGKEQERGVGTIVQGPRKPGADKIRKFCRGKAECEFCVGRSGLRRKSPEHGGWVADIVKRGRRTDADPHKEPRPPLGIKQKEIHSQWSRAE